MYRNFLQSGGSHLGMPWLQNLSSPLCSLPLISSLFLFPHLSSVPFLWLRGLLFGDFRIIIYNWVTSTLDFCKPRWRTVIEDSSKTPLFRNVIVSHLLLPTAKNILCNYWKNCINCQLVLMSKSSHCCNIDNESPM